MYFILLVSLSLSLSLWRHDVCVCVSYFIDLPLIYIHLIRLSCCLALYHRILLSFGRLRTVLAFTRALFNEKAEGADGLNFNGLQIALEVLHGTMQK